MIYSTREAPDSPANASPPGARCSTWPTRSMIRSGPVRSSPAEYRRPPKSPTLPAPLVAQQNVRHDALPLQNRISILRYSGNQMFTEVDTCRKYVVPTRHAIALRRRQLQGAGWDRDPHSIAEQRLFTESRIIVRGRLAGRGSASAESQFTLPGVPRLPPVSRHGNADEIIGKFVGAGRLRTGSETSRRARKLRRGGCEIFLRQP